MQLLALPPLGFDNRGLDTKGGAGIVPLLVVRRRSAGGPQVPLVVFICRSACGIVRSAEVDVRLEPRLVDAQERSKRLRQWDLGGWEVTLALYLFARPNCVSASAGSYKTFRRRPHVAN